MRRFAILAVMICAAACTGCAQYATPTRCAQAATGLQTADELTAMFVQFGGNPLTARKLADAVVAGRMLLAAACAQAGTGVTGPVLPEL